LNRQNPAQLFTQDHPKLNLFGRGWKRSPEEREWGLVGEHKIYCRPAFGSFVQKFANPARIAYLNNS
jgi:hypothetical protein